MIRRLVVDDHPAFRRGLELMLAGVDDVEIAGEAETGLRAVELAGKLSPDVILMDLRMPDLDGIEATRRITRHAMGPAIVVLTMFEDDDSVFAAMRAGARGYLLKGAEQEEIVRAVRAAAAGEAIFGPEIAQRVIAHFASGAGSTTVAFPSLTERERDVLEMVAVGKGNATIAHELMISLKTVRNHVSNVFTKLQVSDRSAAIVMAREAGLGRPDPARSEPGSPTPRTGASLSET
jgi:DNA-binding NarL/FixJ family response regulator